MKDLISNLTTNSHLRQLLTLWLALILLLTLVNLVSSSPTRFLTDLSSGWGMLAFNITYIYCLSLT